MTTTNAPCKNKVQVCPHVIEFVEFAVDELDPILMVLLDGLTHLNVAKLRKQQGTILIIH